MPKSKKKRQNASDLADRIGPMVETAREKAAPLIAEAREKAETYGTEAREKAAPLVAEARDKAAPALAASRERLTTEVLPVITAALVAAGEATEDVRDETRKRGKAAVAALKGEVEAPRERHRLRKVMIVLGLGGVIAFVAKKMSDRPATTTWQSSYTPTPAAPAAGGAHRAGEEDADDKGGASPDVAAADAAASPHQATTPDNPAETIDVSDKN